MSKYLEVPAELLSLIEKREVADRRQGERRQDSMSARLSSEPAESGEASLSCDSHRQKNRRKKQDRRNKSRRASDGQPPESED